MIIIASVASGRLVSLLILITLAILLVAWPIMIYARRLKVLESLSVSGLNNEGARLFHEWKESCTLYCSRMRWFFVGIGLVFSPVSFVPFLALIPGFLFLVGGISAPIYFYKARRIGARLGITNKGVFAGTVSFKPEWYASQLVGAGEVIPPISPPALPSVAVPPVVESAGVRVGRFEVLVHGGVRMGEGYVGLRHGQVYALELRNWGGSGLRCVGESGRERGGDF